MAPVSAMVLALTYRCNAQCAMCGLGRGHKEQISKIAVEKLVESAQSLSGLKVLNITGGEPFLLRNLPELCGRLAGAIPGLEQIALSTNGLLTDRIIEKTQAIYENIRFSDVGLGIEVSLDGPKKVHDAVRGVPGAFGKAIATLKGLSDLSIPFVYKGLGCNVNALTVDTLDSTLQIADSLGAPITFTPVVFNDLYFQNENRKNIIAMSGMQKEKTLLFYESLLKAGRIDSYYYRFANSLIRKNQRSVGCIFRSRGLFIDPHGNVFACSSAPKSKLGSLSDSRLDDLIHSSNTKAIRRSLHDFCKTCGSNCQLYLGANDTKKRVAC